MDRYPILLQSFYKLISPKCSLIFLVATLSGCVSQADIPHAEKKSISVETQAPLPAHASPLKEVIAKQYPDLNNPQTSDWQKVNFLRRWAYKNIVNSTKSCALEKVLKPDFYKKTAFELYTAFKQDKGGVWCGGASIFLEKIYQEYGFNAYTLNMGKPEYVTHMVNLVEIQDKEQKKLVIEDASYNVTFTHQDGSILDYFTFLSLFSQLQDNQVKVIKDNDGKRTLMICSGDPLPPKAIEFMREKSSECTKVAPVGTRCKRRAVLEDLTVEYPTVPKAKQFLTSAGYKPNILYLYMYPFSINSEKVGLKQDLLDRAQAAIKAHPSRKP